MIVVAIEYIRCNECLGWVYRNVLAICVLPLVFQDVPTVGVIPLHEVFGLDLTAPRQRPKARLSDGSRKLVRQPHHWSRTMQPAVMQRIMNGAVINW